MCNIITDPDVAEWDYGAYEGMLSKDIKKERPNWSIWDDGLVTYPYSPLLYLYAR